MIDSGSPVTIIGHNELQQIVQYDVFLYDHYQRMKTSISTNDRYVYFNKRPVDLLGYIFCELEVGKKYIRKTKILGCRSGAKSIIGRDWLNYLHYSIEPKKGGKLNTINNMDKESEISQERWKTAVKEQFPKRFERKGRIKHHQIHADLYEGTVSEQQKGRRVPVQLQQAVQQEINRLLQEGHIVKVDEIKEDVFLQPTVITVKKDRSVKIALDARELNKNVKTDKDPMPNLDNLMEMISEPVANKTGKSSTPHWT